MLSLLINFNLSTLPVLDLPLIYVLKITRSAMNYLNGIIPIFSFACILFCLQACSKSEDGLCRDASFDLSEYNVCIFHEDASLTSEFQSLINEKIEEGMSMINEYLTVNDLQIHIVPDKDLVIPEIGIGGYNPSPDQVRIALSGSSSSLDAIIENNLIPILSHEVHHAIRRRSVGYGNTLLQAVVSEGLADHFAIEVTGISPPPWSIALAGDELENWISQARQTWTESSYNHARWFLGADPDVPRWTGYSIGFELVRKYLDSNGGKRASDLHNEPASSFISN